MAAAKRQFALVAGGRDMAVGPYLDFATHAFDTVETGGGIEWLIPVVEDSLPFVLSAGAFARRAPSLPWEPGIATTLFFGSRSYNFHSIYGLAAGLLMMALWQRGPTVAPATATPAPRLLVAGPGAQFGSIADAIAASRAGIRSSCLPASTGSMW